MLHNSLFVTNWWERKLWNEFKKNTGFETCS